MGAALLPEIRWRAVDENGEVVPFALLYSWTAGTSTPASTYSDSGLSVANTNPIVADAGGLFGPIYVAAHGYKFGLYPADPTPPVVPVDTPFWTQDNVGSPGDLFAANFGTTLAVGTKDVTSGYTQLTTDRLVTTSPASGAAVINLLAASTCTMDLTIKNFHASTVTLTPNGADTVDTNSTWVLEAASDPNFPAVTLRPVTGGWLIVSSHRAA